MITEWFMGLWQGISSWFLGLVPADAVKVPSAVTSLDTTVNGFLANFGGLGVWVPWPLVILCATLAVAVWAVGWLVKGVAWIWGQIPVIGGSG